VENRGESGEVGRNQEPSFRQLVGAITQIGRIRYEKRSWGNWSVRPGQAMGGKGAVRSLPEQGTGHPCRSSYEKGGKITPSRGGSWPKDKIDKERDKIGGKMREKGSKSAVFRHGRGETDPGKGPRGWLFVSQKDGVSKSKL